MKHMQWRIQDFPEEGALTPKEGAPTYYLANFSRKLHENEEILGRGGARDARPPLDPPLIWYLLDFCAQKNPQSCNITNHSRWIFRLIQR